MLTPILSRQRQKRLLDLMEEREYDTVRQLQGSLSQASCPDPAAFERASYMQALVTYAPVPDR